MSKSSLKKQKISDTVCFFDLETTGLPMTKGWDLYHSPQMTDFYDPSRIIEIAYIICESQGPELCRKSFLIKPDNFVVKNSEIHGITQENLVEKGLDIKDVFKEVLKDWKSVNTIVGHNVNFDYHVLLSECYRYGVIELAELIKTKNVKCTMKMGKEFLKIPKYPKLVHLYQYCTNTSDTIQSHRALDDVEWCLTCYFKMKGT